MISTHYTITTTAQVIAPARESWRTVYLHVLGNGTVYLGGADVTSSNGTPTEKHAIPAAIVVPANETLYAIVASGTEDLRVLSSSAS